MQPAPAGSTTTLAMTIANGREEPDTLLRAHAPILDSSAVRHAAAAGGLVTPAG